MGKAKYTVGCPNCGVLDPPDGWRKKQGKAARSWCNLCRRESERNGADGERGKRYRAANTELLKERRLLSRYRLTMVGLEMIKTSQGGVCAICKEVPPHEKNRNGWVVDHNHNCCPPEKKRHNAQTCGTCIRGLLCQNCNKALGLLRDSEERLLSALEYVRRGSA